MGYASLCKYNFCKNYRSFMVYLCRDDDTADAECLPVDNTQPAAEQVRGHTAYWLAVYVHCRDERDCLSPIPSHSQ